MLRHAASASRYYRDTIGAARRSRHPAAVWPARPHQARAHGELEPDRDRSAHGAAGHGSAPGRRPVRRAFSRRYRAFATGGTTGERAVLVYDRDAWQSTIANVLRWLQTMGAGPGTRLVGIGTPTPLHITNQAFAELRSGRRDAPRLSVLAPLPELVRALNDYRARMVLTYPSFARRLIDEQEVGGLRCARRVSPGSAEVLRRM